MAVHTIVKDVVLLLLYMGHQSQIPSYWVKVAGLAALAAVLFTILGVLTLLGRAIFVSRKLVSVTDERRTVLGKPLLFPAVFNHMRFSPVKDRFSNRFLVVGVPVGLRCRIGDLFAVDDPSLLDVSPAPGREAESVFSRILAHLRCYFTVDSARFLHRGDHGLDLREKLDNFLRDQDEDPAQYPFAYLLGVPQFLGWSRAVVSWWYLYSEERELKAMILEINNSYWEKRNVFLKVDPTTERLESAPEGSDKAEYLDDLHLVESLPSAPRAPFYKGIWHKYVFASPFEKVDGLVSNRMMDPLQAESWKPNAPFTNMTTMEETGEVRMATRLVCDGLPIDPTQMSAWDVAKFVFKWTLPGMLTTPEIIFKALKIRVTGAMKMNSKPPVRSGSVGRQIKKLEIDLEPFFRAYLTSRVQAYPEPVELTYLPCRSYTNEKVTLRSPSYSDADPNAQHLTVEPADPRFYTRIINYADVKTALAQETAPTGHVADPTARPLIVSNTTLLASILESASSKKVASSGPSSSSLNTWRLRQILTWSRLSFASTFMDDYVLSSSEPSSRAIYVSSSVRLSMARILPFGSQTLLGLFILLVSGLVRWLVLEGLSLYGSRLSFVDLRLTQTTLVGILGYFFAARLLVTTKNMVLG